MRASSLLSSTLGRDGVGRLAGAGLTPVALLPLGVVAPAGFPPAALGVLLACGGAGVLAGASGAGVLARWEVGLGLMPLMPLRSERLPQAPLGLRYVGPVILMILVSSSSPTGVAPPASSSSTMVRTGVPGSTGSFSGKSLRGKTFLGFFVLVGAGLVRSITDADSPSASWRRCCSARTSRGRRRGAGGAAAAPCSWS